LQYAVAQKQLRVGLFVSLYLDANFSQVGELINPASFPKQSVSGLEFYEGSTLAIDSLVHAGINVKLEVFDLQSKNGNLILLNEKHTFDSLDLVICQPTGSTFLQLVDMCKSKNIPLINATYPNDGGIKSSPNVYIVNPKFNSHLQMMHNQIEKRWKDSNIIWYRRKNDNDERTQSIFNQFNASASQILKYKTVVLNQYFNNTDLQQWIDTNRNNILIAGSLDDDFIRQFINAVGFIENKTRIQMCGMPNWESNKDLQNKTLSNIPIYYTSGFYIPLNHAWSSGFEELFKNTTGVKNAMNAYRGYETTFYFVQLLNKYGKTFPVQVDEPSFKVMTDFDFKAIKWNSASLNPDYFENKRIYFLRRLNNVVTIQ
jgi:ABC-type branched-subunit amino acid transport system substrate-binding protein